MPKKLLDYSYDFDFILIGIVSPVKDYRICWALNDCLQVNFIKGEDLKLKLPNHNEPSLYARFVLENPSDEECNNYLLSNRGSNSFLIPERKETDFFLLLYEQFNSREIIDKLKKIRIVQTAYEIDSQQLKSKENLLF